MRRRRKKTPECTMSYNEWVKEALEARRTFNESLSYYLDHPELSYKGIDRVEPEPTPPLTLESIKETIKQIFDEDGSAPGPQVMHPKTIERLEKAGWLRKVGTYSWEWTI